MFLDPSGTQVGDMVQGEEGIAYGDLDLNACVEPKQFHDVVGAYQRFDVFDVKVNRRRLGPEKAFEADVDVVEAEPAAPPEEIREAPVRPVVGHGLGGLRLM